MRRQPEITDQTRANLLEAFWSLYAEKRFDQITVKEIAFRAGYNRGTFYEYFRDVRHCLDHIESMVLPRIEELPPLPRGGEPVRERFESFVRLYGERLDYYDILLGDRGDPAFRRRLVDSVKNTIVGERGPGAANEAMELDFMLEFILSGMIGVMCRYCRDRTPSSPAGTMAFMYEFLDGALMDRIRRYLD